MWVKDVLDSLKEWSVDPYTSWFLHDNNKIKGHINYWRLEDNYLVGYAVPWVNPPISDFRMGCIQDFRDIIKRYDIPGTYDVKVKTPYVDKVQHLTNVSYDKKLKLFKSAVYWED